MVKREESFMLSATKTCRVYRETVPWIWPFWVCSICFEGHIWSHTATSCFFTLALMLTMSLTSECPVDCNLEDNRIQKG